MPNRLTPNQERAHLFIREYIALNKRSPYLREIQLACKIQSHKSVIDRLTALERKGYIKRKINQHRSIKLANPVRNIKDSSLENRISNGVNNRKIINNI